MSEASPGEPRPPATLCGSLVCRIMRIGLAARSGMTGRRKTPNFYRIVFVSTTAPQAGNETSTLAG